MPEDKNTETKTGAEPADKTKADPSTATEPDDKKAASSTEGEPWHKDPRFKSDLGLLKAAKSLMEKNSLDSVEDLVELFESGKKVKGKQIDLDRLDEIAAKAEKLDRYEAYWRDQEERKRREEEDPNETIKRLESQLREKDSRERYLEEQRRQAAAAQRAINAYEGEVTGFVKDIEIPKEQQGFILKFFGVGNEANDIDITDKKAVKRLFDKGIKEKEAYDQAVIKRYLEGKEKVPPVTTTSPAASQETKPKIMLKDARGIFKEMMQKASGG